MYMLPAKMEIIVIDDGSDPPLKLNYEKVHLSGILDHWDGDVGYPSSCPSNGNGHSRCTPDPGAGDFASMFMYLLSFGHTTWDRRKMTDSDSDAFLGLISPTRP